MCVDLRAVVGHQSLQVRGSTSSASKSAAGCHLFREVPEACDNTLLIAERADVQIELGELSLPEFPVPERFTGFTDEERAQAYLRHLAYAGAKERYGDPLPSEAVQRLDFELGVIGDMGFPAYFLVVWDLIRFARESGIRVARDGARPPAAAWRTACASWTSIPIDYDLLFERFLNPGRKQMPDIDMDFDERYRADVMRYAVEKYGSDRVAQIITFSTIKARAGRARRRTGAGQAPTSWGTASPRPCRRSSWAATPRCGPASRRPRATRTATRRPASCARCTRRIQKPRRSSTSPWASRGCGVRTAIHVAAVVISRDPLTEYLPIQRKPDAWGDPEDAPIVTQYEMHGVEELGLLKMDFLGLRNLSVIERALDLIEAATGAWPDIDNVDLADEPTLEMLRRAESVGVFQLEGGAMRQTLRVRRSPRRASTTWRRSSR